MGGSRVRAVVGGRRRVDVVGPGEVPFMALAVLFLLVGMLMAELSLFGLDAAGLAGALLLAVAALLLSRNRDLLRN